MRPRVCGPKGVRTAAADEGSSVGTTHACRTWLVAAWAVACVGAAQAAPDARHGAEVYVRCQACHALAYDRVGPRHCGLLGRKAGSVPGFAYSPAMRNAHITWDPKTLDRFLAQPLKAVPGSTMTYAGIPDPQDRADLIAYLQQANTTPECRTLKTTPP